MAKASTPFDGKTVLIIQGSSAVGNWLLDHGATVMLAQTKLVRSLQGHARACATNGEEYERYKKRIAWIQKGTAMPDADAVIASDAKHAFARQAQQRGIPVLTPREVRGIRSLPAPQRILLQSGKMKVIDDLGAWGPERTIASLAQWGGPTCVLVAGGDGRKDYTAWAAAVRRHIRPTNLILLAGTALVRMRKALGRWGRGIRAYDSLYDAYVAARARAKLHVSATILLSPAAKNSQDLTNLGKLK